MVWFFRRFWQSLVAIGTLVGILYLPVDIGGLPDALDPIEDTLMAIEREWALLLWATVVTVWIVWRDLRPLLPNWPPLRLSASERQSLAKRSRSVADQMENLRPRLVNGWPHDDEAFHLVTAMLLEIIAIDAFLARKGLPLPPLFGERVNDLEALINRMQRSFSIVGALLETASPDELRKTLAQFQG